jgi:hypothetical protein
MYIMMKFSKYTPNICQIMMDLKMDWGRSFPFYYEQRAKEKRCNLLEKIVYNLSKCK